MKPRLAAPPFWSVTVAVNVEDPEAVGVPEIVPLPEASVSPPGSVPEDTDH